MSNQLNRLKFEHNLKFKQILQATKEIEKQRNIIRKLEIERRLLARKITIMEDNPNE